MNESHVCTGGGDHGLSLTTAGNIWSQSLSSCLSVAQWDRNYIRRPDGSNSLLTTRDRRYAHIHRHRYTHTHRRVMSNITSSITWPLSVIKLTLAPKSTYTHTHTRTHTHESCQTYQLLFCGPSAYSNGHLLPDLRTRTHTHTHTHTHAHRRIVSHVPASIPWPLCVFKRTLAHKYTYTHAHTHTHPDESCQTYQLRFRGHSAYVN